MGSEFKPADQRIFVRHPSDVPIDVRLAGGAALPESPPVNVSFGGICIRNDSWMPIGTELEVRYPQLDPPVAVSGRVVWCAEAEAGGYELGVRFDRPADGHVMRMVEQLGRIRQYQRDVADREQRLLSGNDAAAEWIEHEAAAFPPLVVEGR